MVQFISFKSFSNVISESSEQLRDGLSDLQVLHLHSKDDCNAVAGCLEPFENVVSVRL